ncbi:MAG: Nif3-like dinuclear metal center hexameric protein [Planctomycetes bacterium]|nr:Nif3-like dinuclear metal center hexameric protein [Planctomycetota bacterium]
MPALGTICDFLDRFAPSVLAAEWDNVGLLAGDPGASVGRLMTCLTITPESAAEAVAERADLVVTHHPLPFRPLKRLVTDTTPGRLLWQLATHRTAIYSPHTAFDSALWGINQRLAEGLDLREIVPLEAVAGAPEGTGAGRMGVFDAALPLGEAGERLRRFLGASYVHYVGELAAPVRRAAVACGAAGEYLAAAKQAGCDVLVLGEASFHTCLEAKAVGVTLLMPGHYASERFAVERLADVLVREFPEVEVWPSRRESDPIRLL